MTNNELIEKHIDDWVLRCIGKEFTFREHQKEAIIRIIENIVYNKENHIHVIEAPTGSGKSLIIMIAAGVLSEYYGLNSYILCSDLYLFDQYAEFIKGHPYMNFGMLKGQSGNYFCYRTGQDIRNGECRMAQVSWASLFKPEKATSLGFPCANECEYVKARRKAVRSNVVLMTYQLFLYSMYLNSKSAHGPYSFTNRDIIFCDECHNVPEIIQGKFSPTISRYEIEKFMDIYRAIYDSKVLMLDLFNKYENDEEDEGPLIHEIYSEQELQKKFDRIYERASDESNGKREDFEIASEMSSLLNQFGSTISLLENSIGMHHATGKTYNDNHIKLYRKLSGARNSMCYWGDFMRTIGSLPLEDAFGERHEIHEYVIKQVTRNDKGEATMTYSCTREDYMIYKYILCEAEWKVMLSATVGGKEPYEENIGARFTEEGQVKFETIPSTFDFTKSPIYFLNRYKMSWREKDASFEKMKDIIFNIINKFKGQRGIIHTGSYELTQKLLFYVPMEIASRFNVYNGSKEKTNAIAIHKQVKDSILVGPTLVEGVDLPDDLCRFIIIIKMPYPSMADKLVKEKIKLFPLWYNSKTSNAVIQGIGRGVRNNTDYCETYILDACFYKLYVSTKDQYPIELQKRILMYS